VQNPHSRAGPRCARSFSASNRRSDAAPHSSRSLSASASACDHRPHAMCPTVDSNRDAPRASSHNVMPHPRVSRSCSRQSDASEFRKSCSAEHLGASLESRMHRSSKSSHSALDTSHPGLGRDQHSGARAGSLSGATSDSDGLDVLRRLPGGSTSLCIGALEKALRAVEASLACASPQKEQGACDVSLLGAPHSKRGRRQCCGHEHLDVPEARDCGCCRHKLELRRSRSANRAMCGCKQHLQGRPGTHEGTRSCRRDFRRVATRSIGCWGNADDSSRNMKPEPLKGLRCKTQGGDLRSHVSTCQQIPGRMGRDEPRKSSISKSRSPRCCRSSAPVSHMTTGVWPTDIARTSLSKHRNSGSSSCICCSGGQSVPKRCCCQGKAGFEASHSADRPDRGQFLNPCKPQVWQEVDTTAAEDRKAAGAARAAEARVQRRSYALDAAVKCHRVSASIPIEHTRTSLLRVRAARHSQLRQRVHDSSVVRGALAQ
jgi:hypothetical protein